MLFLISIGRMWGGRDTAGKNTFPAIPCRPAFRS